MPKRLDQMGVEGFSEGGSSGGYLASLEQRALSTISQASTAEHHRRLQTDFSSSASHRLSFAGGGDLEESHDGSFSLSFASTPTHASSAVPSLHTSPTKPSRPPSKPPPAVPATAPHQPAAANTATHKQTSPSPAALILPLPILYSHPLAISPKGQEGSTPLTAQPTTPHTDHSSSTPFNLTRINTPPLAAASEVWAQPVFPRSRQLFLPSSASSSLAGSEDQCLAGSWDDLPVPPPPCALADALLPTLSSDDTALVANTVRGSSAAGSRPPVIHSLAPLVITSSTFSPSSRTGSFSGNEHDSRSRLSNAPLLHTQEPASQHRRRSIDGCHSGSPPQQHASSVPVHAPSPTGNMHSRTSPLDPMLCHPSMMMDRRPTRTSSGTGEGLQMEQTGSSNSSSNNRRQSDSAHEQQQQHLLSASEQFPPTESSDTTAPPVHQRPPIYPSAAPVTPISPLPASDQYFLPSPPPTPSPHQLQRPFILELYNDTLAPSDETHDSSRTGSGHTPQCNSPPGLITTIQAPLTRSCSTVSDHDRRLTLTPTSLESPPLWLPDHNVLDRFARHSSTHIPFTNNPSSFYSTYNFLPQVSPHGSRPASNSQLSVTPRHSSTDGTLFASPSLHGSLPGPRLCSSSGGCGNFTNLPASSSAAHGSAVTGPPKHHRSSSGGGGGGGGSTTLSPSSSSLQHFGGSPAHRHSDGAIAAIAAIAFEAYPHRALREAAETAMAAQDGMGGGEVRMWNAPSPRRSSQPGDAEFGRVGVRMRARSVSESGVPEVQSNNPYHQLSSGHLRPSSIREA